MIWSLFAVGLLMMLAAAFLDNVRGPLLPEISRAFGLSYSAVSLLIVIGNFASVLGNFVLIPLTQVFTEKSIAVAVLILASFSVSLSLAVDATWQLWILGGLLGLSVATLGAVSNLFVIKSTSVEDRARCMSAVHMMYGLGSLMGPVACSWLIGQGAAWYIPLFGLLFFSVASLALLSFTRGSHTATGPVVKQSTSLTREQIWILVTFAAYVGGEVMVSMWMVAYLVGTRGLSVAVAAQYLTGFFLAMAVTRGLCLIRLSHSREKVILVGCLLFSLVFFFLGYSGWAVGFSLAGVLGPFFPLYLARVSRAFPEQSRSLTLWILAAMQLTLAIFHLVVGSLADRLGLESAYLIPPALLGLALGLLFLYFKIEARALKSA